MAKYVNFEKATEDALIYACNHLRLELDPPIEGLSM